MHSVTIGYTTDTGILIILATLRRATGVSDLQFKTLVKATAEIISIDAGRDVGIFLRTDAPERFMVRRHTLEGQQIFLNTPEWRTLEIIQDTDGEVLTNEDVYDDEDEEEDEERDDGEF